MIKLINVKRFYLGLDHQKKAVDWLGNILLNTPAKTKLNLEKSFDWLEKPDPDLEWLEKQISVTTLEKFALLWRTQAVIEKVLPKYFSQRDNYTMCFVTCNSSSHAMAVDYYLRLKGKPGLTGDDEYLEKVLSGKYGTYGKNYSLSWDIQVRVCRSYGLECNYTNESKQSLVAHLLEGNVAPINIWHKGDRVSNKGGGHVILATDYDKARGFLIYDPFGSRPPGYIEKYQGIYWMSDSEFNLRWQGIFTKFKKIA